MFWGIIRQESCYMSIKGEIRPTKEPIIRNQRGLATVTT